MAVRHSIWLGALLACTAVIPGLANSSDVCTEDVMIVFDGSGSMAEMGFNKIDEPRIFEARRAVADVLPQVAKTRRIGLMVYGPGGEDACSGIDLRFGPRHDAAPAIIAAVDALEPAGETPLTVAVEDAAELLEQTSNGGTIVLLTDGKETCGGSPCQLAAELAGGPYTIHVIGFKVRGAFFNWNSDESSEYDNAETPARCLADRTGGSYHGPETVNELIVSLWRTLGCQVLF